MTLALLGLTASLMMKVNLEVCMSAHIALSLVVGSGVLGGGAALQDDSHEAMALFS